MRLWHYQLIPYLPNSQLVSQWRELNAIFTKETNHILINYIYDYSKEELYDYTNLVLDELKKRNINIKTLNNYNRYFMDIQDYIESLKPYAKLEINSAVEFPLRPLLKDLSKKYNCTFIDLEKRVAIYKSETRDNLINLYNDDTFDKITFINNDPKNILFKNHHTTDYLIICYYNLKEKYIRGQKDFTEKEFNELKDFIIRSTQNGQLLL